ncbi:MAG: methyl-accepting chemotaxis protein [Desulfobacterales bacterium]|nr:methyl-accepting chemotaxis protein [Desulfobacterales bacterium]
MNRTSIKNKLILCFLGLILLVMAVVAAVNLATADFMLAQAACTALALTAGVVFGSLFSRSIVRRLNQLSDAARKASQGDLTRQIDVVSRDEIRDLEEIFAAMFQHLQKMLVDIRQVSEQVRESGKTLSDMSRRMIENSREIDKVSREIAEGSEAQTVIVQETSVTVNVNVKAMNRIALQSSETMAKIRDTIAKTQEGGMHAQETMKHLEAVLEQMRRYQAPVSRLTGKVEKIRGIVGVMENIAQKTDLLALNASIEATRAGESGKGFALVADEIRAMADSSKKSSAHISRLVEEILEENQDVSQRIGSNQQDINEGTRIIHGIINTFEEMLAGVKEIFANVQDMEKANSRQMERMKGLTEHFQKLYKIAKQNFVSTQKTTVVLQNQKKDVGKIVEAVKGLSRLSEEMMEKQQTFRLPEMMQ